MYDDRSPEMNTEGAATPTDPHAVLDQVAEIDVRMGRLREKRESLLNTYHKMIEGYSAHFEAIVNRPVAVDEYPSEEVLPRKRY